MPDICLLLICHRGGECSRWAISAVPLPCGAVFKKGSFLTACLLRDIQGDSEQDLGMPISPSSVQ